LHDNHVKVVATGCLTAIEPGLFSGEDRIPQVIPNLQKSDLVKLVLGELSENTLTGRIPIPGGRTRTRAFIKAQDGCNNFCTFCITRIARGKACSVPVNIVIEDIKNALRGGVREVVLTGVHLGSWGSDLGNGTHVTQLVEAVSAIPGEFRIRLSSLEPWDLYPEFFNLWLKDERLCRHFHLPLQSGSSGTLRRMARNTTPEKYNTLIDNIRAKLPDVTITTDMIVGFPGETEDEFSESLEFVRRISFDGGHVFTYSPREGTPAARYNGQIPQSVKRERSQAMRLLLSQSGKELRNRSLNIVVPVLWEGMRKIEGNLWQVAGLTNNNHRVITRVERSVSNQVLPTRLIEVTENGFLGDIIMRDTQEIR
jgi:threonylcarbamoyladenosine tRNA methylthiotransferase MtaB